MKIQSQAGFTLIELIVALCIVAILMGVGIPSFTSAVKNSRQSSTYQSLVGALFLARSEAVKRSDNISVCARQSSTVCGGVTDWNKGWIVFSELSGPGTELGRIDPGETVLALFDEVKQNDIGVRGTPSGQANASNQHYVQYGPLGASNWTGGTITVCDDRGEEESLAMNIVLTGDIRKARPDGSGDTTPMDINGVAVQCP